MHPFDPKPAEILRARYYLAVAEVRDFGSVESVTVPRAGAKPECFFDYEDGVRLIVSRESYPGLDGPVIHLSASVVPGTEMYKALKSGLVGARKFVAMIEQRFRELSGSAAKMHFAFLTPGKAVPHWFSDPVLAGACKDVRRSQGRA